jgi:hypothetical protein
MENNNTEKEEPRTRLLTEDSKGRLRDYRTGRYAKGHSGNPDGRPSLFTKFKNNLLIETDDLNEIKEIYLTMLRDPNTPATVRAKIADDIFNRFFGKPVQAIDIDKREVRVVVKPAVKVVDEYDTEVVDAEYTE